MEIITNAERRRRLVEQKQAELRGEVPQVEVRTEAQKPVEKPVQQTKEQEIEEQIIEGEESEVDEEE